MQARVTPQLGDRSSTHPYADFARQIGRAARELQPNESCGILPATSARWPSLTDQRCQLPSILRASRDATAQTGRGRVDRELRSSLWEHCLSLGPGHLGSIQSLNGRRAGDRRSLAVWTPPWTAGLHGIPWMQGIFPAFGDRQAGGGPTRAGNLASFPFSAISRRKNSREF